MGTLSAEQRIAVWVVIAPEGHVTWSTALGPVCHQWRANAISEACRLARWDADNKDPQGFENDEFNPDQARRAGFRVRKAWLVVPAATVRK